MKHKEFAFGLREFTGFLSIAGIIPFKASCFALLLQELI
jgi:hypothetical protein